MIVTDIVKEALDLGRKGTSEVPFVFWDGYGLERPSGVFVHAHKLYAPLHDLGVEPVLLGNQKIADRWPQARTLLVPRPSLPILKFWDSKLIWPVRSARLLERQLSRLASKQPVVLHGLSNLNLPLFGVQKSQVKTVLTVHDLIPLICPEGVSKAYYWQFRLALSRVAKLADRIVCVSQWTRSSLLDRYPELEDKTLVIPNGVDADWKVHLEARKPSGDRLKLLCNTRYEVYKDMGLVFELVRTRKDYDLTVITDVRGRAFAHQHASDLIRAGRLNIKTEIAVSELGDLYRRAHVLVHPSKYEGYGLPAVEALTAGLPVVYLSGSGIDEVVGSEVGIGLDGEASAADWIRAIDRVASWAAQDDFVEKIREHLARLPSWKDAALALKTVYTELR